MFKFFAPSTPPPRVEAATEALHGERWCQEIAAGSLPVWGFVVLIVAHRLALEIDR